MYLISGTEKGVSACVSNDWVNWILLPFCYMRRVTNFPGYMRHNCDDVILQSLCTMDVMWRCWGRGGGLTGKDVQSYKIYKDIWPRIPFFWTNKMILWITHPSKKIWTRACIYNKMFNALFMCLTLYNLPTVTQIFLKLSNYLRYVFLSKQMIWTKWKQLYISHESVDIIIFLTIYIGVFIPAMCANQSVNR